ncbi:MAG: polysaccharide deacetylase family protein [Dysgonamonadaceae bacterium]|jgi:peptidoglycan/xylan/chitin deacetylase (PgdA/CDA1 family)|nr:polysaccharide deacetylase family protein [Dysgonamonadaceae bacterium]
MLIERPPLLYRALFPNAHWRFNTHQKVVYLTFDDGPIPEVTPWVLDLLDKYHIPAAFFCVADNVRKHPEIYQMIKARGHLIGNHTFHHLQGWKVRTKTYLNDVAEAEKYIDSSLFRPPHGHLRLPQFFRLRKKFRIIMWDVVTRDYSRLQSTEMVLFNVKKYTRNGSIIVFHDSLKAEQKMKQVLPQAIEWLLSEGYTFKSLADEI